MRHRFIGWQDGALALVRPDGATVIARPDAAVLALGGASWPRLGSDGGWVAALAEAGVTVVPLRPANCGFVAPWSEPFRARRAGAPLKRIAVTFEGRTARGEAIITAEGLEGGAIYALSAPLREAIALRGEAVLAIDLRPDVAEADLTAHIAGRRRKESLSTALRKTAKLSAAAIDLVREAAARDGVRLGGLPPPDLARLVKAVPVRLTGIAAIARAISTAGGVSFAEVDGNFMLRKLPGFFVAGEMLDWDAPTGGYLLQAAFATGVAAAEGAIAWMAWNDSAWRTRI
jgi:uncharacterized flavoprotein (TIGR03862 family)